MCQQTIKVSNMKIIILFALCLTAALAVPAPKPSAKLHPLLAFAEKFQPKFEALKDRKLLHKLVENPPGLKEVWEQFNDSMNVIYKLIQTVPSRVVPMIKRTNTQSELEKRLPEMSELAALTSYNIAEAYVTFLKDFYESFIGYYPPEASVVNFIFAGLVSTVFEVPYETIIGTGELIKEKSAIIGLEYDLFIEISLGVGLLELSKINEVFWEAIDASKK